MISGKDVRIEENYIIINGKNMLLMVIQARLKHRLKRLKEKKKA
jgi:hypothetical protein